MIVPMALPEAIRKICFKKLKFKKTYFKQDKYIETNGISYNTLQTEYFVVYLGVDMNLLFALKDGRFEYFFKEN